MFAGNPSLAQVLNETKMSIHSRVESIPTTPLGKIDFPRLTMGIHPFDGVSYQSVERDAENLKLFGEVNPVADVIGHAVQNFGFSVAQVDHMNP